MAEWWRFWNYVINQDSLLEQPDQKKNRTEIQFCSAVFLAMGDQNPNGNLRGCNDISLVKKFSSLGTFQLICLLMKGIEYQVLQGVKEAHNSQA